MHLTFKDRNVMEAMLPFPPRPLKADGEKKHRFISLSTKKNKPPPLMGSRLPQREEKPHASWVSPPAWRKFDDALMSDNTKQAGNPSKPSASSSHRMEALQCYFMFPSIWVIVCPKYFWRKWIQTCFHYLGVQKGASPVFCGVSGTYEFQLCRIAWTQPHPPPWSVRLIL